MLQGERVNLLVPIKQVPDLVEELELNEEGTDLNRDAVQYKINEFDDHALEEALQLKAETGATVTALALEGQEADKLLFTISKRILFSLKICIRRISSSRLAKVAKSAGFV